MTGVAAPPAPMQVRRSAGDQSPVQAGRLPARPYARVVKVVSVGAIWAMPLLVPAGPGNTAPADVFLALAIIVSALWFAGRRQAMRFPYAVPVGLSILAGALASTVAYASAYDGVGSGLVSLVQDGFVLAWSISIANLGRDAGLLRSLTRAWAISATFWAAVMILGVAGHISVLSGETARTGVQIGRASCRERV